MIFLRIEYLIRPDFFQARQTPPSRGGGGWVLMVGSGRTPPPPPQTPTGEPGDRVGGPRIEVSLTSAEVRQWVEARQPPFIFSQATTTELRLTHDSIATTEEVPLHRITFCGFRESHDFQDHDTVDAFPHRSIIAAFPPCFRRLCQPPGLSKSANPHMNAAVALFDNAHVALRRFQKCRSIQLFLHFPPLSEWLALTPTDRGCDFGGIPFPNCDFHCRRTIGTAKKKNRWQNLTDSGMATTVEHSHADPKIPIKQLTQGLDPDKGVDFSTRLSYVMFLRSYFISGFPPLKFCPTTVIATLSDSLSHSQSHPE